MCGVSGFWGPRDRALLEAMTAAQVHRGPDDLGFLETDDASLGLPPPQHHRPDQRPPADEHRRRARPHLLQRRGLQLPRAAGRARSRRATSSAPPATPRSCSTPTPSGAPTASPASTACGASPSSTSAATSRGWCSPATTSASSRCTTRSPATVCSSRRRSRRSSRTPRSSGASTTSRCTSTSRTASSTTPRPRSSKACARCRPPRTRSSTTTASASSATGSRCCRRPVPRDPADFRAVFDRAVERRLVADVPVGICLSGGLDSSSICTVMAASSKPTYPTRCPSGNRLQTFSAVFPGDPIDETRYIDSVLEVTGAATSRCEPTAKDFVREMEPWVWHIEEPMVSSAPFAMWMVMRLAREKVTVTLDGQGGDELLGGYDHYPYVYLRELLKKRRYRTFAHEAWRSRDIVGPLVRRRLGQRRHPVDVRAPPHARARRGQEAPGRRPGEGRLEAPPAPGLHHVLVAAAAALRGPRVDGALARGAAAVPRPGARRVHPRPARPTRSSSTAGTGACCARA